MAPRGFGGGWLPRGVFLAVASRLDPPSHVTWMRDPGSSPSARPPNGAALPRSCAPPPLPLPLALACCEAHLEEIPEGEAIQTASLTNAFPLVDQASVHPGGFLAGEAIQLDSPACAAFPLLLDQSRVHPDGLLAGEALQLGSEACAAFPPLLDQARLHPGGLLAGEALQLSSHACAVLPPLLDQAGVHSDGLPEGEVLQLGSTCPDRPSCRYWLGGDPDGPPEGEALQMGSQVVCSKIDDEVAPQDTGASQELTWHSVLTSAPMVDVGPRIPRPRLSSPMANLPRELILMIAREVARSSTRDAVAMKLCCKSWNEAFEVYGPFLAISQQYPAPFISLSKIVWQQGPQGPLALRTVNCISPPPVFNLCWGSSQGLLALKDIRNNNLLLHCVTCGFGRELPALPLNHVPQGIYICRDNFILSVMTDVSAGAHNDEYLDNSMLYLLRLDTDAYSADDDLGYDDEGHGINWTWGTYPGTEGLLPMRTVNFTRNLTFAAATSTNVLILDRIDRQLNEPFAKIRLAQHLNLDECTATWMHNGQHIFICGSSAYVCVLTRSILKLDMVGIRCFLIQQKGNRFTLSEVKTVGPYSIYLGSNQPIVLPSINNVAGRSPSTVYIEDNDGIVQNSRVLAISISTQEVQEIPFPDNVAVGPSDSTSSSWTTPMGDNCCHVG